MGVLGQIALGVMEGLIDGMSRAANDSRKPRPGFRCVYSLEVEIKWDSDYLRVFTEALRDFAEKTQILHWHVNWSQMAKKCSMQAL